MLPHPTDEGDEHDCSEGVSELEKNMLLAFKTQENWSSDCTPNYPRPHNPSSQPAHPQVDQDPDQNGQSHGGSEGLRHASPLCIQPQKGTDAVPIQLGQQAREKVVDETRVVEDGYSEPEQTEPPEKRPCQEEAEDVGSYTHPPRMQRFQSKHKRGGRRGR
jgi:hypothetical protein